MTFPARAVFRRKAFALHALTASMALPLYAQPNAPWWAFEPQLISIQLFLHERFPRELVRTLNRFFEFHSLRDECLFALIE